MVKNKYCIASLILGLSVYILNQNIIMNVLNKVGNFFCSISRPSLQNTTPSNSRIMAKISVSTFLLSEDVEKFLKASPEESVSWATVRTKSNAHPIKFPRDSARLNHLLTDDSQTSFKSQLKDKHNIIFDEDKVEGYINSTYPIIHEDLMILLGAFLAYKKDSGTRTERDYYRDKTIYDLIDKLLKNRPIAFLTSADSYLLHDGRNGVGGFEDIGAEIEGELKLSEYNSYDEMRLAALVGVSSVSPFINKGDRYNKGEPGDGRDHEMEGVIIGQVGARFEKRDLMEWQDCAVYPEQNAEAKGYGKNGKGLRAKILKAWAGIWGEDYLPTYEEVKANPGDYEMLRRDTYLNKKVYKARMRMMAEVLLIEASSRAKALDQKAYIHVVGLGLGVWQIASSQQQLYVAAFVEAIDNIPNNITKYISTIDFSWIEEQPVRLSNPDIKVIFSRRNLHDTVPKGCLLVCNYAWDSNSAPGNEYWMGSLTASGDPAAACSSSIAELQNARINPRVSAQYLRLASPIYGVVSVKRYLELISKEVEADKKAAGEPAKERSDVPEEAKTNQEVEGEGNEQGKSNSDRQAEEKDDGQGTAKTNREVEKSGDKQGDAKTNLRVEEEGNTQEDAKENTKKGEGDEPVNPKTNEAYQGEPEEKNAESNQENLLADGEQNTKKQRRESQRKESETK